MRDEYKPGSVIDPELASRIGQAIGDPALALTVGEKLPDGLVARPVIRYTIHCSHCGTVWRDPEFEGVAVWQYEPLLKLGDYAIDESGDWELDVAPGYPLGCPDCAVAGWCETCGDKIRAWEPIHETADRSKRHLSCGAPEPDDAEQPADKAVSA